MDVPASIRRSLPLGMIGKVFIYFLIPTYIEFERPMHYFTYSIENASNAKSESSLRYSMRITNISTFILNFDWKKSLSRNQLRTSKVRSKQTERKLRHRGHGQKLYENKQD